MTLVDTQRTGPSSALLALSANWSEEVTRTGAYRVTTEIQSHSLYWTFWVIRFSKPTAIESHWICQPNGQMKTESLLFPCQSAQNHYKTLEPLPLLRSASTAISALASVLTKYCFAIVPSQMCWGQSALPERHGSSSCRPRITLLS